MVRIWTVVLAALLSLAVAPVARADTGDIIAPSPTSEPTVGSGWQAGTCNKEPPEAGAATCSIATPTQFFEQAAGHPNWGFTQFIVKHEPPGETPVGEVKTIRVDLPVGLSVNPGATERCPLAVFESGAGNCASQFPESKVGESLVTAAPVGFVLSPAPLLTQVPVYNVAPKNGEAARFGLELAGNEVFLEGDVAWAGDYHEGFTIHVPAALPEALGVLLGALTGSERGVVLKNRLIFDGRSGDGTFLTTPSTCLGPAYSDGWTAGQQPGGPSGQAYSTLLRADSLSKPNPTFPEGSSYFESAIPPHPSPPASAPTECDSIPYDPSIAVDPATTSVNSPSGATVDVEVPHLIPNFGGGEDEQDSSDTRAAQLTLPPRMGINPSAANGLQVCSDAEFGKGTNDPNGKCPAASKIGTVRIESPPLPEGDLEGDVYVGQQLSRDPTSGQEYRIFVEATSPRYGIVVRLIGNVSADPVTGQLTTTFSETPQVPFTSFQLQFDGGPRAVLSSPPTCGPNDAAAAMTPWSGNPPARPGKSFQLSTDPAGGTCSATMAGRPFSPSFAAAPAATKAGAFSPFDLRIGRVDGQQELKGATVATPPGLTGKLAGIPYCPEAALAAAAGRAGYAEQAGSSCPAASLVGHATVAAGTGPSPYSIGGKVFLSGPYHGAPLSLAVVTPATAGPFDLGTVVVRVALFVDPETARVTAVSDPIPDVFGGTQLSIRSVDVDLDRQGFTLNPTSCGPLATEGALNGGGADPANAAAWSSFPVSAPFQTSECGALGFRPKLKTTLLGGKKITRRSQHPRLRSVFTARPGDANVKRAALTLPHSLFLDQGHIGTICTRVQLAAHECPARSVYGYATAKSPLLDDELKGPVYLVSSDHELPDLLVNLQGQVNVRLRGVISAAKARIKTVFYPVPDVPVSKFVLTMKGGRKGLLVNSRNLCAAPNRSVVNFAAQNGKRLKNKRLPLRVPACKSAAKGKR